MTDTSNRGMDLLDAIQEETDPGEMSDSGELTDSGDMSDSDGMSHSGESHMNFRDLFEKARQSDPGEVTNACEREMDRPNFIDQESDSSKMVDTSKGPRQRTRRRREWSLRDLIRQEMLCTEKPHLAFIPESALRRVLCVENIARALEKHIEQLKIDTRELIPFVSNHATKIFAILVWMGNEAHIEAFYRCKFGDEYLPVQLTYDVHEVVASTFKNGKWEIIENHPFESWTERNLDHFGMIYQCRFLSPIFRQDAFMYHVIEPTPMPFVDCEPANTINGGTSVIEKRRIHRDHLQMPINVSHSSDEHPWVAVKQWKTPSGIRDEEFEKFINHEAKILKTVRERDHPHLLKALACYTRGRNHHVILPWAAHGDLHNFWEKCSPSLDERFLEWIFGQLYGLASGIERLHRENVRHGDLRPEKILCFDVTKGEHSGNHDLCTLVIAYMGSFQRYGLETSIRFKVTKLPFIGSNLYESPEMELHPELPRSRRYDIWSLGCIYLEFIVWLLFGRLGHGRFRIDLHRLVGPPRFYVADAGGPANKTARLNSEVMKWIEWIRKDPRCTENTVLRELLELVVTRLLVPVDDNPALKRINTNRTTFVSHLDSTPISPIVVRVPTTFFDASDHEFYVSRATANEIVSAMKQILRQAKSGVLKWVENGTRTPSVQRRYGDQLDPSSASVTLTPNIIKNQGLLQQPPENDNSQLQFQAGPQINSGYAHTAPGEYNDRLDLSPASVNLESHTINHPEVLQQTLRNNDWQPQFEPAPKPDSGYASTAGAKMRITETIAQMKFPGEISEDLQDQSLTDDGYVSHVPDDAERKDLDDSDETTTIYSLASSISDTAKDDYISRLAEDIFGKLHLKQSDVQSKRRISEVLPEVLRVFALKLGHAHSAQTQIHREVMFFIHKNRRGIATRVNDRCLTQAGDYPDEDEIYSDENASGFDEDGRKSDRSDIMPLGGKMERYFNSVEGVHMDRVNDEEQNTSAIYEAQEPDDGDSEDPATAFLAYQGFILESPAYEWLLARLRGELLLYPADLNIMKSVNQKILDRIPKMRKISKRRPAEAYRAFFRFEWNPSALVQTPLQGETCRDAVETQITLSGSAKHAQALTCAKYLSQTWPSSGKYILDLIQKVLDAEAGNKESYEFPDHTELTAWFDDPDFVVETLGTRESIAEIGEQLAWLGASLRRSTYGSGVEYCKPVITDACRTETPRPDLGSSVGPEINFKIDFEIQPGSDDLEATVSRYLHGLLSHAVIVAGYPVKPRSEIDTGLEVSLRLLEDLAQTRRSTSSNGRYFLEGPSTILIPVQRSEDIIVWHMVHGHGPRSVSHTGKLTTDIGRIEESDIENVRHIIGSCTEIGIRLDWTCVCGHQGFDYFTELKSGAIDDYAKSLVSSGAMISAIAVEQAQKTWHQRFASAAREHLLSLRNNLRRTRRILAINLMAPKTTSVVVQSSSLSTNSATPNSSSATTQSSNSLTASTTPAGTSITSQSSNSTPIQLSSSNILTASVTQSANDKARFLLACIKNTQYSTRIEDLNTVNTKSDKQLFEELRDTYHKRRKSIVRFFSLYKLKHIRFIQFALRKNFLADCIEHDMLPPDTAKHYEFDPRPAALIPPVGENHMMHLFSDPHEGYEDDTCLKRFPKRIGQRPERGKPPDYEMAWGIHFVEGPHLGKMFGIIAAAVIIGSLLFGILYWVMKHDVQGAFTVAAYMTSVGSLLVMVWQMVVLTSTY